MSDVVWEDPPERPDTSGGPGRAAKFIDTLRAHPGQWAVYPYAHTSSSATNMRRRYPRIVEIATRFNGTPGRVTIYIRWVGSEDGDS